MITTFSYDDSGPNRVPRPTDPVNAVATVVSWGNDGARHVLYSPFDGPPAPDDLLVRLRRMLSDPSNKWDTYWHLFTRYPWCEKRWAAAAQHAALIHQLPCGFAEDVLQDAQLKLYVFLSTVNLLAWLSDPLQRFEFWFRKLVSNHCNPAARGLQTRFATKWLQEPASPVDSVIQSLPDYREKGSPAVLKEMLGILDRYPERTKDVALLRWTGHSWDEVAAVLSISVDAARWAVEPYRDQLAHDFASFR